MTVQQRYHPGDLVEARKGDDHLMRGRLFIDDNDNLSLSGVNRPIDELAEIGFGVYLIEPALGPLPTEHGSVVRIATQVKDKHYLAWRAFDGTWDVIGPRGDYHREIRDLHQLVRGLEGCIGSAVTMRPEREVMEAAVDEICAWLERGALAPPAGNAFIAQRIREKFGAGA